MPCLRKEALAQYIRTGCKRQLRQNLSPDTCDYQEERALLHMPPPQTFRPGLEQLKQAGDEWQAEKIADLAHTFGVHHLYGTATLRSSGQLCYHPTPLLSQLHSASPPCFFVEAAYEVGATFEAAQGISHYKASYHLDYASLRPDLIELFPPGTFLSGVLPSGQVEPLASDDPRLQLRIIEIKLTSEPSPSYFAEVAYYTIALACWLVDQQFDQQYVVVSQGAIWSGSHEASQLMQQYHHLLATGQRPSFQDLHHALEQDIEPVPFDIFALWLRQFLHEDLAEVLRCPSWQTLEWHVDHRCQGCPYLGYPTTHGPTHPDYCWQRAQCDDHISRIAFISRGASSLLQRQGVQQVSQVAQKSPADPIYDTHQSLRFSRSIIHSRARSLLTHRASIASYCGTSILMPRWADLHIFLSVDFDLGSAITFALGVKAFWREPRPYQASEESPRATQGWKPRTWIIDQKSLHDEQRELLAFLTHIQDILTTARDRCPTTTVQFYIWDHLQYDHLTRVVGRHLEAILQHHSLQHLAWLFPSEEILPNYAMVLQKQPQHTIIRKSPITIVRDVIRTMIAAPIPHYYSLFEVARVYHARKLSPTFAQFHVHPLFHDPLSDQIPFERAHEIWSRATVPRPWLPQLQTLEETIQKKLRALETVTQRLEEDLRPKLSQASPWIAIHPPKREYRLSFDGMLLYAFAKLDEMLAEYEVQRIRAMPPHEREARLYSIRCVRRLSSSKATKALARFALSPQTGRYVYKMRPHSKETKLREGDFSVALAPEDLPGFLDQPLLLITQGTPLEPADRAQQRLRMEEVTSVTIRAMDRDRGVIVLDAHPAWSRLFDDLEYYHLADFSKHVIIDPVHHDYFTGKLLPALQSIGNPLCAHTNPLVRRATGQLTGYGAQRTPHTPPADFFWNAPTMYRTFVTRHLAPVRALLQNTNLNLNPVQWEIWTEALQRRLALIWGPPGTGKSRTVRAIVVGAVIEAVQQQKPLRVLICSSTYTAIETVFLPVYHDLSTLLPHTSFACYRLRSHLHPPGADIPSQTDLEIHRQTPSARVQEVMTRLQHATGITLVGATPEQVYNFMVGGCEEAGNIRKELFDLLIIDEASQMDMAHFILPLCTLAAEGCLTLAGDTKQLAPIHRAEAPLGLEDRVGSVYAFYESVHQIPSMMLSENYRSNNALVHFQHQAGYQTHLRSFSPHLQMALLTPFPSQRPATWPASLYWTPEWAAFLDPGAAAACFVYSEDQSSQWNLFEADAIVALVSLLYGRIACQPHHENDPRTGLPIGASSHPYSAEAFWAHAVGVVTPHRAQQSLIVNRLQKLCPTPTPTAIRNAVDTVERFQGQQRDIILASLALGDPDAIANEDKFLLSMQRFNVMVSRARTKVVLFVSRQIVNYLSQDMRTLWESRLLKHFVDVFCAHQRPMTLGWLDQQGAIIPMPGVFHSCS